MNKDSRLSETAYQFEETMVLILERRAIIEALEEMGMRSQKMNGEIKEFFRGDYHILQLVDLRKFFDKDKSVHKFRDLTRKTKEASHVERHKSLYKIWKDDYEVVANKFYFHSTYPFTVGKSSTHDQLNKYIDAVSSLLDDVIGTLRQQKLVNESLIQQLGNEHFVDFKEDARRFVRRLANGSWKR